MSSDEAVAGGKTKPSRLRRCLVYFGLARSAGAATPDPPGGVIEELAELRAQVARNTAAIESLRERLDR